MQDLPPSASAHPASRPFFATGLGILAIAVAALHAQASRAGSRCGEDVCLELALPPHQTEVRQATKLECLLVLPAAPNAPVTVRIILLNQTDPAKCFCRNETLQPGSAWKRSLFDLSGVSPGVYAVGVVRAPHVDAAPVCSCSGKKDGARFVARTIRVTP